MFLNEWHLWVELVRFKDGLSSHSLVLLRGLRQTKVHVNPKLSILWVKHDCLFGVGQLFLSESFVFHSDQLTLERNLGSI